jgi:hypothetical protein
MEGKNKEARALSDKLEELGPDKILDPYGNNTEDIWNRHCFNRGWFMLQEGNYQLGSKLCEYGRALNTYGSPQAQTNKPLFNPEQHNIKDKILIINLEGGYGDEIIHARFAQTYKELGAKKVYLAAAPELVDLLNSVPGVDKVILRDQYKEYEHDFWLPGFSAGWLAGHTFESLPNEQYIFAKQDSIDVWKQIINSPKLKVGIRWAGNPKFEHQQYRRFPENFILNLAKYSEIQLYSLQRDNNILELPNNIIDLQHLLLSWDDTAAAIANLDLVISSCTSIAHLSAAMGKKTYVIVPILPYHTWCYNSPDSTTSPYYKSVKLYRQQEKNKWNKTFQNLYKDLETEYNLEHKDLPNEDKIYKKLNLASRHNKVDGFVNVDRSALYKPDVQFDLNIKPWPFKDSDFIHIVSVNTLSHIAKNPTELLETFKEMYRISENGAVWEIEYAHYSNYLEFDFYHNFKITLAHFFNLNQKDMLNRIKDNNSYNLIPFENGIDVEILDVVHEYQSEIKEAVKNRQLTEAQAIQNAIHMNNIIKTTRVLMEVHKPGRITLDQVEEEIARLQTKSFS